MIGLNGHDFYFRAYISGEGIGEVFGVQGLVQKLSGLENRSMVVIYLSI